VSCKDGHAQLFINLAALSVTALLNAMMKMRSRKTSSNSQVRTVATAIEGLQRCSKTLDGRSITNALNACGDNFD